MCTYVFIDENRQKFDKYCLYFRKLILDGQKLILYKQFNSV